MPRRVDTQRHPLRRPGREFRPAGQRLVLADAKVVIGQLLVLVRPLQERRYRPAAGVESISIAQRRLLPIVATERVRQPLCSQLTPCFLDGELDATIKCLLAFVEPVVEFVAVRIKFLEAIACKNVELVVVIIDDVQTAGCATGKKVLALDTGIAESGRIAVRLRLSSQNTDSVQDGCRHPGL